MKVSGAYTESISSMSQNMLRMKEETTIRIVTEKLSKEGKHVINIIHGTPSTLMGEVSKSLTFLWEADDKDPVYNAVVEEELREKRLKEEEENKKQSAKYLKKRIKKSQKNLERDINALSVRISVAKSGTLIDEKQAKKNANKQIVAEIFLCYGLMLLGITFLIISGFCKEFRFVFIVFGVVFLFAGIILGALLDVFKKDFIKKEKEKQVELLRKNNKQRIEDQKNLMTLENKLKEKKEELSAYMNKTVN